MKTRGSGILLHISSLPSQYGIGDLGPWAYRFVEFLAQAKQSFWQILPLNPTDLAYGNSPYSSISAFAVNTLFINPEFLMEHGWLTTEELKPIPNFPKERCDYHAVVSYKMRIFDVAFEHFKKNPKNKDKYEKFCADNTYWLEDYALFVALKEHFQGRPWYKWPQEIKNRYPPALEVFKNQLQDRIEKEKFLQYIFLMQWFALKNYCQQKGIQVIGDIPIYGNYDSVDVWSHPEVFKLNAEKKPSFLGGVPPDYFSKTGQLWGSPVYDWERLQQLGYAWWVNRIAHNLNLYDMVRIDHFRAFVSYWEVPADAKTAVKGKWVKVPTDDFFGVLKRYFGQLPLIAEDLGIISDDVKEVIARLGFPGMRLLLFAFGEDLPTHPYLPHNYVRNCFVYTGTHDNNTARGWFEKEAKAKDRQRLFRYLGNNLKAKDVPWELIRLAMMSIADKTIIPFQDLLGLDEKARMNRPATCEGNWQWRLLSKGMTHSLALKLGAVTRLYGRA